MAFDRSAAVPVEVKAGDVLFLFNGYLLHASFREQEQNYRRAVVNHYMNALVAAAVGWIGGLSQDRSRRRDRSVCVEGL